jgi:hypothetical protein
MSIKDNLKFMITKNQESLKQLLDDISESESLDRAGGLCNPIIWQTGHLAWCADTMVWLLGGNKEFPGNWTKMFEYGSKLPDDDAAFPPFMEVRYKLYELRTKINSALEVFDESKFADEVELAEDWKLNRLNALFAFSKHDFYHAGQITIVRKKLGRPQPFG